jgi:hypothetical protein
MDSYNPALNAEKLPSPCKESPKSDTDFYTKLYCYGILSLWLMLMLSALIYQIRAILPLIERIPNLTALVRSILQSFGGASRFGWLSSLFGGSNSNNRREQQEANKNNLKV